MATAINQYSQINIPRYNPRTLEEQMIAPMYMREQQNAVDASISGAQGLVAQNDALNEHGDRLAAEQARLNEDLSGQRDSLLSEGFSPAAKSNFMRFNKDYQQSISPTGEIGTIQSAVAAMASNKETFIANSTAAGYPPDKMAADWEKHRAKYTEEFKATGKITDIKDLYSPKFYDLQDSIIKSRGSLSADSIEMLQNGKYTIEADPQGYGYHVIHTDTRRKVEGSNARQIKTAVDFLTGQFIAEGAPGKLSVEAQGMEDDYVLQQIKSGLGLASTHDVAYKGNETFRVVGGGPTTPSEEEDDVKSIYTHSSKTAPYGDNYNDGISKAQAIIDNPKSTDATRAAANDKLEVASDVYHAINESEAFVANKKIQKEVAKEQDFATFLIPEAQEIFENADNITSNYIDGKYEYTINEGGKNIVLKEEDIFKPGVRSRRTTGSSFTGNTMSVEALGESIAAVNRAGETNTALLDAKYSHFGVESTTTFIPYKNTAEFSTEKLNFAQAILANNSKVARATILNPGDKDKPLNVDDTTSKDLINRLASGDIRSMNILTEGSMVGLQVEFTPSTTDGVHDGDDMFKTSISEGGVIRMYIPINKEIDPLTGAAFTPTQYFSKLDSSTREELKGLIFSSDMSAVSEISKLSESKIQMSKYLKIKGAHSDTKLSFFVARDKRLGGNGKGYIPYSIDGIDQKPVAWDKVLGNGGDIISLMGLLETEEVMPYIISAAKKNPYLIEKYGDALQKLQGSDDDASARELKYKIVSSFIGKDSTSRQINPQVMTLNKVRDFYYLSEFANKYNASGE